MLAFLGIISHYKYLITAVLGIVWVGFVDENSFVQRFKYDMRIRELSAEIQKYDEQTESANQQLHAIATSPKAIEKIARERYFMKAENEDIFVLSTDDAVEIGDQQNTSNTDETTE